MKEMIAYTQMMAISMHAMSIIGIMTIHLHYTISNHTPIAVARPFHHLMMRILPLRYIPFRRCLR